MKNQTRIEENRLREELHIIPVTIKLTAKKYREIQDICRKQQISSSKFFSQAIDCKIERYKKTKNDFKNKKIIDVCCGSKMFWFNKKNPHTIFLDKRNETFNLKDSSSKGGYRSLTINPDIQADFTNLPFPDETFFMAVFDPPHLVNNGENGWLYKKYGKLGKGWEDELKSGFSECFRVLKKNGTLIFKWSEHEIPVSQILKLTRETPLIGNKSGKSGKTHWLVFMK